MFAGKVQNHNQQQLNSETANSYVQVSQAGEESTFTKQEVNKIRSKQSQQTRRKILFARKVQSNNQQQLNSETAN